MGGDLTPSGQQKFQDFVSIFMRDLVIGTMGRLFRTTFLLIVAFLIVAYFLRYYMIIPYNILPIIKIIISMLLFIIYGLLGIIMGILFTIAMSLRRNIIHLEEGLHLIVAPLTQGLLDQFSGTSQTISYEEFTTATQKILKSIVQPSILQYRLLSPFRLVSYLLYKVTYFVLRKVLIDEFIESHKQRNLSGINIKSVEPYAREKMVRLAAQRYYDVLSAIHILLLLTTGIILVGPFVVYLIA